nr:vegetative cell wall protein gp1-like [Lolium perenne]
MNAEDRKHELPHHLKPPHRHPGNPAARHPIVKRETPPKANSGRGPHGPTGPDRGPPTATASRGSAAVVAPGRPLRHGLLCCVHPQASPPRPPPPRPSAAAPSPCPPDGAPPPQPSEVEPPPRRYAPPTARLLDLQTPALPPSPASAARIDRARLQQKLKTRRPEISLEPGEERSPAATFPGARTALPMAPPAAAKRGRVVGGCKERRRLGFPRVARGGRRGGMSMTE